MRLVDAKGVAAMLQVRTQRVYELTRQGILPSVRIGARQIRFE
jgi:predicted DNA-binding transcriptional regulator AlpA